MQALIGVAAQGDGAARALAQACRAVADGAHVLGLSRPWWAPARADDRAGLLAVAHVETERRQRLRPWLWGLQARSGRDVQLEVVAGLDGAFWRFDLDLEGEDAAWTGPVADVAPHLPLRSGMTAADRALVRPHPGAFPWMDAGKGRWMERPAALDARHVGRTWETRTPADRAPPRRAPTFLP